MTNKFNVSNQFKALCAGLMVAALFAVVVGHQVDAVRIKLALLVAGFYFTSLCLGGLFFTALQHVTKAGWSVNVRRFSESMVGFTATSLNTPILLAAILPFLLIVLVGGEGVERTWQSIEGVLAPGGLLYKWWFAGDASADYLLQHKRPYLNPSFFSLRFVVFWCLWLLFGYKLVRMSLRQDKTGDTKLTHKLLPWSVVFVLVFALTYSLLSVDWLMSLEAHWFSTIFGVYCFAGLFQSTMAAMILLIVYAMRRGWLDGVVTANHLHDLGKFMFAFTVFWAYIAFSQYMLIWYANLPEETMFYLPRSKGEWLWVSLALLVFRFVVPFLMLLPRWAKRQPEYLSVMAVLVLIMQWVDIYWLVYPSHAKFHDVVVFGWMEVLVFLGCAGSFMLGVTKFLSTHPLVPTHDPRGHESQHHKVLY